MKNATNSAEMCGTATISLPVRENNPCREAMQRIPSSLGCMRHSGPHLSFALRLLYSVASIGLNVLNTSTSSIASW